MRARACAEALGASLRPSAAHARRHASCPAGYGRQQHTGLTQLGPTAIVVARPPPAPPPPLPPGACAGETVIALKLLARPPRGNGVRERHGLATLRGVEFAEQARRAA